MNGFGRSWFLLLLFLLGGCASAGDVSADSSRKVELQLEGRTLDGKLDLFENLQQVFVSVDTRQEWEVVEAAQKKALAEVNSFFGAENLIEEYTMVADGGNYLIILNENASQTPVPAFLEELGLTGFQDFVSRADGIGKRDVYVEPELYISVQYYPVGTSNFFSWESMSRIVISFNRYFILPESCEAMAKPFLETGGILEGFSTLGEQETCWVVSPGYQKYMAQYFWQSDAILEGLVSEYPYKMWIRGSEGAAKEMTLLVIKPYYETFHQEDFTPLRSHLSAFGLSDDACDRMLAVINQGIHEGKFPDTLSFNGVEVRFSRATENVDFTFSTLFSVTLEKTGSENL